MTIKTNFFDGIAYNSGDLIAPWQALLSNGIFNVSGGALAVTQNSTPNMTVNVAAGSCMLNGYFVNNGSPISVPINGNASGYNRYDIIVVDVDLGSATTTIKAVMGTPSSSPTVPLPTATQIVIANVFVGNNVSAINTANITDGRANAGIGSIYKSLVLGSSGYILFTCGLMLQWVANGVQQGSYGSTAFLTNFPNECWHVFATMEATSAASVSVANLTTGNFNSSCNVSGIPKGHFFAIGY
ncbi:gp53-like domain-containing protein [Clostridium pasteurianum]|uniref:Putative tail fiber protein gp53-like C-terminal domain-containing protein n=1 Tax=Clostridium pasteurianum BC1 TaxID=86416 RepID=R4K525_CLOPA|nr:hypothetical protein [Clostridium pasteurianum]AGK96811.1 hypothetical protein Clopa_1911 [Clostridium pasteurianum BC1]